MSPKLLDGRYELHEPLGSGGMARVFRGLDVELRRPVAIKLLPEDRAHDEHLRARMVREAQAMARLNHPHVVQVYGCSRATSDTPYVATELVDGIDLGEALLENGSMPWELALWVVERCLAGLAAIHATLPIRAWTSGCGTGWSPPRTCWRKACTRSPRCTSKPRSPSSRTASAC